MNNKDTNTDDYRKLLLLDEIAKNEELTQRDLSDRLGVALGLVNSYLKNLVSKGYVTVSTIPRKRYTYYLTSKGLSEKARLTYHHLQNFTNLYRVARKDFRTLFTGIAAQPSIKKIGFCGIDEITEIALLSLNEVGLELSAVIDSDTARAEFFGHKVLGFGEVSSLGLDLIVITSFKDGEELTRSLTEAGVDEKKICDVSRGGWLKKIETATSGG